MCDLFILYYWLVVALTKGTGVQDMAYMGSQRTTCGLDSFILLCGHEVANAGFQDWLQVLLSVEASTAPVCGFALDSIKSSNAPQCSYCHPPMQMCTATPA